MIRGRIGDANILYLRHLLDISIYYLFVYLSINYWSNELRLQNVFWWNLV